MRRDRQRRTPGSAEAQGGEAAKKTVRKKRAIYVICALLAAVIVGAAAMVIRAVVDQKEYNRYMAFAEDSFQSGDYDSALSALRKAAAIEKTDECMLLMSEYYEAQGNLDKALEILREMDVRDSGIAARIALLEQRKAEALNAAKVTIAGKLYDANTTSLVLNDGDYDSSILTEVAQLRALESFSAENNRIEDVSALKELGGLVTLNLGGNRIADISPLTSLTGLRTLSLDGNPISDLMPLCSMVSLTSLSLKGMDISERELQTLREALPGCAIHSEAATEEAQDISFGGITFKSDVTELSLSGMGIRDVAALAGCDKLVKLDLSGNEISDLSPLMNLPELEWLDVSNNALTDLRPLMGIDSLSFLNAAGNSITSTTPLFMMNGLTELYLDGNPISDFSGLKKMVYLNKLGLSETGLEDDDLVYLEGLTRLSQLFIKDNSTLSGEAVDALQAKINPCEIDHSELVYSIIVDGYTVGSTATELDLASAGISDLTGLQGLAYLESVNLEDNSISNIYILEFTNSRFTIRSLDLSDNLIEDITPLACLKSIETLDLRNNGISSLQPLMMLTTLKTLYIGGNSVTEQQIMDLQFALPDCEIIVE